MAAKKELSNTYTVYADLKLNVGLEIHATSLEDAVIQAMKLTTTDFVGINGEFMDDEKPFISGIYTNK